MANFLMSSPADSTKELHVSAPSLETLSPLLKALIEKFGLEDTQRFISAFGGMKMLMPRSLAHGEPTSHPVVQALGVEFAQKLGVYFDGEIIQVPNGKRLIASWIRQQILADLKLGLTINKIAQRHGVTSRTVYSVKAKYKLSQGSVREIEQL